MEERVLHKFRSGEIKEALLIEKEQFCHIVYRKPNIKNFEYWYPKSLLEEGKEFEKKLRNYKFQEKAYRSTGPSCLLYDTNGKLKYEEWQPRRKNKPSKIWYDKGIKLNEYFTNEKDEYHNENGPASIYYSENGKIRSEEYFRNGKMYREGDKPTIIEYTKKKGRKIRECWFGEKRKNDLPTEIIYFPSGKIKSETWQKVASDKTRWWNTSYHRIGKPAVKIYNKKGELVEESYYKDNELHREGGPALIKYDVEAPIRDINGDKIWDVCNQGEFWRAKKEDVKEFFSKLKKIEIWFENAKMNRTDGPAVIYDLGEGEQRKYFIDDKEPTGVYLIKALLLEKKVNGQKKEALVEAPKLVLEREF